MALPFPGAADFESDRRRILADNLAECRTRFPVGNASEAFHIRELADEIRSVCEDAETVAGFLVANRIFPTEAGDDATGAVRQKELLYRDLARRLPGNRSFFFPGRYMHNDSPSEAGGRIACQHNHFSDSAYLLFAESGMIRDPRADYRQSALQICEAVYHRQAEYGILPIGNTSEGKLTKVVGTLLQYSLSVLSVCKIPAGNASFNEYLLVGTHASLTEPHKEGTELVCECILPCGEAKGLDTFLRMASRFGLLLRRIDTVAGAEPSSSFFDIVFAAVPDACLPFLVYLSVEHPEAIPLGIFPVMYK